MSRFNHLAFALVLTLPACTAAPLVPAPAAPLSVGERVAVALAEGDRAESTKARAQAAQTLAALGAKPADSSTPDLARTWANETSGKAATTVYRGRILGPAYQNGSIVAGAVAATHQLFLAGQVAHVSVSGSRDAQLNLVVTDGKGNPICQVIVGSPVGSCKWLPLYSERFQVTIGNIGPQSARYFLVVN
jgi:hypothetical protein